MGVGGGGWDVIVYVCVWGGGWVGCDSVCVGWDVIVYVWEVGCDSVCVGGGM